MQAFRNRCVALACAAAMLGGCTIPRTGPFSTQITEGEDVGIAVVEVAGPQALPDPAPRRFSETLRAAGPINSYLLGAGDVLQIQVWEQSVAPDADGAYGEPSISLPRIEIDENGDVFVPFAGRVRAAGRSVSAFHEALTTALAERLINPQVSVSRVGNESTMVNVIGAVNTSGPVPLGPASRSLLDVLTRAGGPTEDPDVSKVTLMRGNAMESLWLGDVYGDRSNDVSLRSGDTVLLERDERSFIVLGAVNQQTSVPFPARRVTALRALAEAEGLNDDLADPTGVFVFRRNGVGAEGAVGPVVYLLDLNRPDGMLLADGFEIADGDMIYVTNAPITSWLKVLRAIVPTIGLAGSVAAISN